VIRHIVMWNVRGDTREEKAANVERVKRSFDSLRGCVPGLLHLEVGVDASRIDYACDVVLVSDFESQAALQAYAAHPEHLRVKRELGDLRTHRYQVDYEVSPPAPSGEGRGGRARTYDQAQEA
jgi:heme-degrading monooxygenase HmoA